MHVAVAATAAAEATFEMRETPKIPRELQRFRWCASARSIDPSPPALDCRKRRRESIAAPDGPLPHTNRTSFAPRLATGKRPEITLS